MAEGTYDEQGRWYAPGMDPRTPQPPPPPPPVALPNDLTGNLRNWLQRAGYRAAAVPLRFGPLEGEFADAQGRYDASGITFRPEARAGIESLAGRYGRRGRLDAEQLTALKRLTHEMVHAREGRDFTTWNQGLTDRSLGYEEAATYQAVDDLMPAMTRQLFGASPRPPAQTLSRGTVFVDPYQDERATLRQASVFGSGAGKYQDRAARLWRRQFTQAEEPQREQMMSAATAIRMAAARKKKQPRG